MLSYILSKKNLNVLIGKNRLAQVLVRYRGTSEGRFFAPAQEIPALIETLTQSGRYVRDMSTNYGNYESQT